MRKILNLVFFSLMLTFTTSAQQQSTTDNVQIIELNDSSFKKKVWDFDKSPSFKRVGNLPIILDFHATWCRPCKMLAPHMQTIQNMYNGKLIIYKIDVDKSPAVSQKFGIRAMPTLVFINTKTTYKTEVGYREFNDLDALVKSYFFVQ